MEENFLFCFQSRFAFCSPELSRKGLRIWKGYLCAPFSHFFPFFRLIFACCFDVVIVAIVVSSTYLNNCAWRLLFRDPELVDFLSRKSDSIVIFVFHFDRVILGRRVWERPSVRRLYLHDVLQENDGQLDIILTIS